MKLISNFVLCCYPRNEDYNKHELKIVKEENYQQISSSQTVFPSSKYSLCPLGRSRQLSGKAKQNNSETSDALEMDPNEKESSAKRISNNETPVVTLTLFEKCGTTTSTFTPTFADESNTKHVTFQNTAQEKQALTRKEESRTTSTIIHAAMPSTSQLSSHIRAINYRDPYVKQFLRIKQDVNKNKYSSTQENLKSVLNLVSHKPLSSTLKAKQ